MTTNGLFVAVLFLGMGLLLGGCEDGDGPTRAGDSTITVVNDTDAPIHVQYQTQTWDALTLGIADSHEADVDLAMRESKDLSVHFANEVGTSRLVITKGNIQKNYDIGFGNPRLAVRTSDFVAN